MTFLHKKGILTLHFPLFLVWVNYAVDIKYYDTSSFIPDVTHF